MCCPWKIDTLTVQKEFDRISYADHFNKTILLLHYNKLIENKNKQIFIRTLLQLMFSNLMDKLIIFNSYYTTEFTKTHIMSEVPQILRTILFLLTYRLLENNIYVFEFYLITYILVI